MGDSLETVLGDCARMVHGQHPKCLHPRDKTDTKSGHP